MRSKNSTPTSTSQARVLTANNPPSRALGARLTLPALSRRAIGDEMRSKNSTSKTRRLTAYTKKKKKRGAGKYWASSERGKPGISAPGVGHGSGWTRLCLSYSPTAVPIGTLPLRNSAESLQLYQHSYRVAVRTCLSTRIAHVPCH